MRLEGSVSETPLSAAEPAARASGYSWYVAVVLMLVYTLSFIDRKLPFILLEQIRHDLSLSDTQLGLLTGLAFTAVYAVAALPIARLSDRASRKTIIGVAIAVWSVMTAVGGLATNFIQLALARSGVAIGESACTPAGHSMLGDLFPNRQRSSALALYMAGAPLGILLGMSLGGWVAQMSNWRVAMMAVGLPGLLLCLAMTFGVREPVRTKVHRDEPAGSIPEALSVMFRSPVLRHILFSGAVATAAGGASNAFAPAYMIRTFGLSTAQTGVAFGLVSGIAGLIGVALGGFAGDYLRSRSEYRALMLVAVCLVIGGPLLIAGYLVNSLPLFLLLQFIPLLLAMVYAGPCFATIQAIVRPGMRSMATAIYMFALNGVGVSLGPLVAGAISDSLRAQVGVKSLGYGLAIVALGKIWGGIHLYIAARHLRSIETRQPFAIAE